MITLEEQWFLNSLNCNNKQEIINELNSYTPEEPKAGTFLKNLILKIEQLSENEVMKIKNNPKFR